jgi:hypothetical protein
MSVVGLDFGNANSVIALARRKGIDVVLNGESKRETPSMVNFGEKQVRVESPSARPSRRRAPRGSRDLISSSSNRRSSRLRAPSIDRRRDATPRPRANADRGATPSIADAPRRARDATRIASASSRCPARRRHRARASPSRASPPSRPLDRSTPLSRRLFFRLPI